MEKKEEVIELHSEAESLLRIYSFLIDFGSLPPAPLFEIQNASRHIIKALSDEISDEDKNRELEKAWDHYNRVIRDMQSFIILELSYKVKKLLKGKSEKLLDDKRINLVNEKLKKLQLTSVNEDELYEKNYQDLNAQISEVTNLYKDLEKEYSIKIEEKYKAENYRRKLIAILTGIISLLASFYILLSEDGLLKTVKQLFNF